MNEIRFNSPSQNATAKQASQTNENPTGEGVDKKNRNLLTSKFKKISKVFGIVVILVVIIFLAILGKDFMSNLLKPKMEFYSAVFLSNGQVYFGKIEKNDQLEIVLTDVFYIQVNDNATAAKAAETLNQPSFNLIKLGNELHGPTDELFINRSQVVFYEKLRDDSKVVESIKNYKQ